MPTAVVTGATSGIGAAFAEQLAAKGYDLVLVARTQARLDATAADLTHRFGGAAEVLPADLADRAQLQSVADRVADPDRPVDLLVNAAGFALGKDFLKTTAEDEERLLDVLTRAILVLCHAAAPVMTERGRGGIINVSSVAGWTPTGTYSAAKAWVIVFSESLAGRLKDAGVRVVVSCPGYARTEFHDRADLDMSALPAWAWQDPATVAEDALAALANGRVVTVPGIGYRAAAALARHAPSSLVSAAARSRRPRSKPS